MQATKQTNGHRKREREKKNEDYEVYIKISLSCDSDPAEPDLRNCQKNAIKQIFLIFKLSIYINGNSNLQPLRPSKVIRHRHRPAHPLFLAVERQRRSAARPRQTIFKIIADENL